MTPLRTPWREAVPINCAVGALEGAGSRNLSSAPDRCVEASSTLQQLRSHFLSLGITRLGDLTGLDTLGIPVAFASRPNSFSLSLSLGKGLDRESALASAAMEAAELAIAERRPASAFGASVNSLRTEGRTFIDLTRIARCQPHLLANDTIIEWIEGIDLLSGKTVLLPWSLVGLDHRVDPPGYHPAFEVATDGLASGNTTAEAVLHAIYELIERDAYALHALMPLHHSGTRSFLPICSDRSGLGLALARIELAGLEVELVDITSDLPVPAHLAKLTTKSGRGDPELDAQLIFVGCGCHSDPVRSMVRAIIEAAQARAAYIAGARDDFQPAWRDERNAPQNSEQPVPPTRMMVDLAESEIASPSAITTGEQIENLLSILQEAAIEQVIVVELPAREFGIRVVRVVIPDLQIPLDGERSQVTSRGLRHVLRTMS
jgi:YcaO-like protein with predicted kinase domain